MRGRGSAKVLARGLIRSIVAMREVRQLAWTKHQGFKSVSACGSLRPRAQWPQVRYPHSISRSLRIGPWI